MPRDLADMLHHHRHNNMFEYSSRKRTGGGQAPGAPPHTQAQLLKPKDDAGYRDRVF